MASFAGLVRVSHLGGRNGDRFHADVEQVEVLERHARAHGARLQILPPELDISGGLPLQKRPSLLAAVEGIERGDFDTISVAYLSRLGRTMDLLRVWDRVEAAGGRIVAVQEGIDTSTPTGRHMRNVLLSQASMERELHAERFEHRRREATAAGIWQRRQTPLGYRRDETTRRLVPDDRADDVRWAFRARAAGCSISEIAQRLGMTTSGVRQLLRNRVYLGELRVGEHVNVAAHEPLVDEALFESVQMTRPRPPRSTNGPALLGGVVRCASCGHVMTRKRTATLVYACPVRHSGAHCPEPASITAATLDAYVEKIAVAELARLTATAHEGHGVERAQEKVAAAERELTAYTLAISIEDVGVVAFKAGARKRRAAVGEARDELQRELALRPAVPESGTGADAWELLDVHERNTVLRGLLEAVVVARAGGRGARVPLADRVRVVARGADLRLPERSGGAAAGIVSIPFDELDDEYVLRELAGENPL